MATYEDVASSLGMALDKANQLVSGDKLDAADAQALDDSMRRHIESARVKAEEIALENREKKRRQAEA